MPAYSKLKSVAENFADSGNSISLEKLKGLKNSVYSGTDDPIANAFLRGHGELIGEKSKSFSQLNLEFAPARQARKAAIRTFQPYEEQAVSRGAKAIENIASGKELDFIKTMESGSGRFKGIGKIGGKTTELVGKRKQLLDSAESRIRTLSDDIEANKALIRRLSSEEKGNILTRQATLSKRKARLQAKEKELGRLNTFRRGLIAGTAVGVGGLLFKSFGKKVAKTISSFLGTE